MKYIKLYENFNFNEDDFDFEEEQPTTTFQIGDAVEFVNNENVIITMVNNLRNSSNSIGTKAYVLDIKIHMEKPYKLVTLFGIQQMHLKK